MGKNKLLAERNPIRFCFEDKHHKITLDILEISNKIELLFYF